MIQEIQTNNFELYRLKDISPIGVTYNANNVGTNYKIRGNYRFIMDTSVVNGGVANKRTRIYNLDWSNETVLTFLNGITIVDVEYWDNKYYFTEWSTVRNKIYICNSDCTSIETTVNLSHYPNEIFKYKNKWFIYDGETFRLNMYNSNSDGHITLPLSLDKRFASGAPDNMNFGTNTGMTVPEWVINYNTGELISITYDAANSANSYYGRYDLDKIINKSGDYLIQRYSSVAGEIPYNRNYNFQILDGHYFIPKRDPILANNKLVGYSIYDFEWNKVAENNNLDIIANRIHHSISLTDSTLKEFLIFPNTGFVTPNVQVKLYKLV
jgi:hypothetical protein